MRPPQGLLPAAGDGVDLRGGAHTHHGQTHRPARRTAAVMGCRDSYVVSHGHLLICNQSVVSM